GDVFADIAVGTDHKAGGAAAILDRLRRRSKRRERVEYGARPDRRLTGDVDMSHKPAAVAKHDIATDDTIRTDRNILPDHRARFDPGGWIDRAHRRPHATIAPTSASATVWPATFASPRNHHMFFFRAVLRTWYSIVSPGTTGLRNLALSMVRKKTCFGWSPPICDSTQIAPAVCAMPSISSTPGNTGLPGKCPTNCGSLTVTFLIPMAASSPRMSMMRSTIKNG